MEQLPHQAVTNILYFQHFSQTNAVQNQMQMAEQNKGAKTQKNTGSGLVSCLQKATNPRIM